MPSRPTAHPPARTIRTLTLIGALSLAGLAAAQPASPPPAAVPPPPPQETAPKIEVVPAGPAASVTAPAAPDKDLGPAPPPPLAKPATPVRRNRYDVAVIEALDKVTAESLRFEAQVNHPVRYKSLVFTVKACERSSADEPIDDSIAYVTVDSQPRAEAGKPPLAPRQTFKGWMYASSPGLHPLEHPIYDAWLITCRAAAPAPTASPTPAAPAH